MEISCIEDGSSEGEKQPPATPEHLQRMGSGASVVLDPLDLPCTEVESRKLPSSRYKGVVPQPNGRWGAQIYERHQRVWLGTFNDETEAAQAYDVAAQRFRGRDAFTNFEPLSESNDDGATELAFLRSRSKAEVVDMLRKHTYHEELRQSRRTGSYLGRRAHACASGSIPGSRAREQLFEKVVTPSDVGKLNRLVIPKQHAEKNFPLEAGGTPAVKGVLLSFEDLTGKLWRFRYSYWNSSQSYVLTKGWSRFVKEMGLNPGDVVSFHRSTTPEKQLYIECRPQLTIGCTGSVLPAIPVGPSQVVRLFGVNIVKTPELAGSDVAGLGDWSGKRSREIEFVQPPQFLKKRHSTGALLSS